MKKNNESSYTIFNQMKDCLKKQGLPVFEDDLECPPAVRQMRLG